ncbi:MAG: hypothetical protein HY343_00810 [Lentisphaerae bacterium]|nr:hypothetical protein [Lentisphaerota bacterium]
MTVNITIDLSPAVARRAARKGLLKPDGIGRLIEREVVLDKSIPDFRRMVAAMRDHSDEPMTMDEIQAEVKACRSERRARESRR